MIAPGETIGILGGGQLGRMLAMAAAQLGYRVHIFAPEPDAIAAEVAAAFTCAAWDDTPALARRAPKSSAKNGDAKNSDRGDIRFWDSPLNEHEGGILARSSLPAPAAVREQVAAARALAQKVAEALDYVGVLTCEFFATQDGPVFNEIAPRVHNSGHWTIEGAITSQFENHIRAICGLPLGDTTLIAKGVEMRNIIGANQTGPKTGKWAAEDWDKILSDPANHLHLYGKAASRPGRKMGHVTRLTLA